MTKATHIYADANAFGRLLRRLRLSQGWTITEMARRSGLSKNHLGMLELGKNMPSLHLLFTLAELFRVEASEMVREVEQERRARKAARAAAMLSAAGIAAPRD